MEGHRTVRWSLVVAGLFALGASSCAWLRQTQRPTLPQVLPPSPRLEQVIEAVNNNSAQIYSFSTDEATVSVPGTPSLRASIAFERPRRLRLRAGTGVTGTELDAGSNDELFWVWVKRQPPLYYCRHDRFAVSPARRMVPIEPEWLIEALGITGLDPALPHQGPNLLPGGRLEIRTARQAADGPTTRITHVDAVTGVVLEQSVYDHQGVLVARASASRHRRDPGTGLIMPGIVEIECPRAQFSMRIDLGNVRINPSPGISPELWTMPDFHDWPTVDLGDPNIELAPVGPPVTPPARLSSRPHPPRPAWNRMPY